VKAACGSCGEQVGPQARFCPACGTRLGQTTPTRSRFMSVLFCDLVASTALNEAIGDEAMFALLAQYQDLCRKIVAAEGGYVAKFMGDGMLAYFGFPGAMKNSAGSAVSAALSIIEAVAGLVAPGGTALCASAGVATGWMVVGDANTGPDARETLAIGGTVNMAARLRAATRPGTVAVGDAVCRRLDPGGFARRFLGLHSFKGFGNPVAVWAISRDRSTPALPDFVGREGAMATLDAIWHAVQAGQVRAVEIVAPGGFGKTTLARRHLARVANDHEIFEIRGMSHRRDESLGCLKVFVQHLAGITAAMDGAAQRDRLAAFAPEGARDGLALLLGIETEPVAPLVRQARIAQALGGLMQAMIGAGRAVLFVEDAHWIDPETWALLDGLPAALQDQAVLLIATRRPEGAPLWPGRAAVIDLATLPEAEAEAMLDRIDRGGDLPPDIRAGIVRRAQGVPLYLEHIARAVLERPDTQSVAALPDTMIEALLERFDRTRESLPLVEAAAVLGPVVRVDVLAQMLGQQVGPVSDQIAALVGRGLFTQDNAGAVTFEHALVRDAVLETLLTAQRVALHARALAGWEAVAPDELAADAATAARHLLGAARPAEAIPHLVGVAKRAIQTGALGEAMASLTTALGALDDVPAGAARDHLEMIIRFFVGSTLVQTRGFADAAVNAAYQRALDLCLAHAGGSETEFQIIWGIWAHMLVVGETATAARMSARMDAIVRDLPALAVLASSAHGVNAFTFGALDAQERDWAQTDAAYDIAQHGLQAITYLMDARELALLFRIHGRYIAGDLPGWRAAMAEAAAHEARLGLPFLAPYIRVFGTAPHCYAAPGPEVRPALEAAVGLAHDLGQPFWMLSGSLWLAAEKVRREGHAAALPDQQAVVAMCHATGLRLTMAYHEALLARSLAETGQHDAAATMIAQSRAAIAGGQDRLYLAEVLRQEAEIMRLARPRETAAVTDLLEAARGVSARAGSRAWGALIAGSQARLIAQRDGAGVAAGWLEQALAALALPGSADHPAFGRARQMLAATAMGVD